MLIPLITFHLIAFCSITILADDAEILEDPESRIHGLSHTYLEQIIGHHVPEPLKVNCIRACPKEKRGTCLMPFHRGSRLYYRCIEGRPLIQSCHAGTVYSAHSRKCVPTPSHAVPTFPVKQIPLAHPVPLPLTSGIAYPLPHHGKVNSLVPLKDPNLLLLTLAQSIGGITQLLTVMLEKVLKLDKRVEISVVQLKKMNLLALQAIEQSALVCKSRLNLGPYSTGMLNGPPFYKNDSDIGPGGFSEADAGAEFQALIDQKVFETFNAEDSADNHQEDDDDDEQDPNEKYKEEQDMKEFQAIVDSAVAEFKPKDDFDDLDATESVEEEESKEKNSTPNQLLAETTTEKPKKIAETTRPEAEAGGKVVADQQGDEQQTTRKRILEHLKKMAKKRNRNQKHHKPGKK